MPVARREPARDHRRHHHHERPGRDRQTGPGQAVMPDPGDVEKEGEKADGKRRPEGQGRDIHEAVGDVVEQLQIDQRVGMHARPGDEAGHAGQTERDDGADFRRRPGG